MHPRSLGLHFGSSASTCLTGGSRESLRSVPRVEATRELSLQKFDVHGEVVNREPRGGWLEHGICSRPFCSRSQRCLCGRVCGSARTCLCFLFPFYRTECSERSCYCMCLMSHMEAVRLQECFGNIMPGTDNLSSSSSLLSHCFCCHTHLKLFTPLLREAGISPPQSSFSMG